MMKCAILLLILIIGLFTVNIIIPWAIRNYLRNRFLFKINKSGCTCLTFDDGPDPNATPEILRILEEAKIRATFFVLGENVNKYPELILQIERMGHEIGAHSCEHIHPWKCWPFRAMNDLSRGYLIVKKSLSSKSPILVRPPYGKFNLISLLYALVSRHRLAFWDVDPKDYRQKRGDRIVEYIMSRLTPGSVILFHDGRGDSKDNSDATVSALRLLLRSSKKGAFRYATISEALRESAEKTIEAG